MAFKIVMFPKCGLLKMEDHLYPMTVAFADSVALLGGWLGSWFDFPVVCLSTQQTQRLHAPLANTFESTSGPDCWFLALLIH